MSHLRFCHMGARLYLTTKLQMLRLSSCTLRLCRINKHGFCTTFPVSLSFFTNTVSEWWNCFINLFWSLRLIMHFHFARQPSKTKLLPRILYSVKLVLFVYMTKSQSATAQLHAATLSCNEITQQNRRCDIGLTGSHTLWVDWHHRCMLIGNCLWHLLPVSFTDWFLDGLTDCWIGLLRRWSSSAITRVPWRVCCWKNPSSAFALRTTSTGEFLALSSKSNKWQRQMCCSAVSRTHYTGQWIVYQNTMMHFYHKSIYSSHSDYFVGAFHVSFWFIWNLCVLSSQIFTGQESCNPSSIDRQCLTCLILFIGWCIYRNRSQS